MGKGHVYLYVTTEKHGLFGGLMCDLYSHPLTSLLRHNDVFWWKAFKLYEFLELF